MKWRYVQPKRFKKIRPDSKLLNCTAVMRGCVCFLLILRARSSGERTGEPAKIFLILLRELDVEDNLSGSIFFHCLLNTNKFQFGSLQKVD